MDEVSNVLSSLYVTYDLVSKAYSSVQEFTNDAVCVRALKKSFTSNGFELNWCKDFVVYKLGDRCLNSSGHQFFYFYPEDKLVAKGSDIYDELSSEQKEKSANVNENS